MKFKALRIDVGKKEAKVETVEKDDIYGIIDYAIYLHTEVFKTYELKDIYDPKNVLVFGIGPFAGALLPGFHRLTFFFRSPLYKVLYPSTLGGAGYIFLRTGVDFVAIEGKAEKPTIIIIKGDGEEPKVEFHEIELEKLLEIWKGYKGEMGVYALTQYLIDEYGAKFEDEYRILCVGPAALNTNFGAIFSQTLRKGKRVEGSEDWAARGGSGSVLLRAHNVVAIIYGGKAKKRAFPAKDLSQLPAVKEIVESVHGKPMHEAISEHTVKYRYNPKLNTGGTFGGNFPKEKELLPILNWQTPYYSIEDREAFYKALIANYWEPFNKEVIEPKNWTSCGEPCPVVCKKYHGHYKIDYEPYEANGPLCGIIYLPAGEEAVHAVDSMGFDAIEFGGLAAWVLELLHRGLLKPEEVGLSDKPVFELKEIVENPVEAAKKNAKLVAELAKKVAFGEGEIPKVLGKGMRLAAKYLDEKFKDRLQDGTSFADYAVYTPLGEDGAVCPTMYWAIGNYIPLPVQGKYWTYYQFGVFLSPQELAEKIVGSALYEYWFDNVGLCRFQRGWAKKVIKLLFKEGYGIDVDLEAHAKKVMQKLIEYAKKAGYKPVFWDSKRVIDLVAYGAEEFGNKEWAEKFKKDKLGTAKEYLAAVLEEYSKLIGADWKL